MSLNRNTTITYLGHSTLLIDTPGGKRILIDPWLQGNPSCPPEYHDASALKRVDLVLMTHIHNDHADSVPAVVAAHPDAGWVGVFEATGWLQHKGAKNVHPMNTGGCQSIDGIEVIMTHALHSSSYHEADGTVVYGGVAAGYILRLENGFTIYAAGDTALFGDMQIIGQVYRPELALLPIGDVFTMGPAQAARAAGLLGVQNVIPIHHSTFPLLTGTPESFAHELAVLGEPSVVVHALKPGESVS